MSDSNLTCSVCGSKNIEVKEAIEHHQIPYGTDIEIKNVIHVCSDCGSEIDVTKDEDRTNALMASQKASVEVMINFLAENSGYTFANIERALSLPQRTLSRWKTGQDPSAAGLALLRIIRTYPWITDVAVEGFEEKAAKRILMEEAVKEINSIMANSYGYGFAGLGMAKAVDVANTCKSTVIVYVSYSGGKNQEPEEYVTSQAETLFVKEGA
jgi:YgiT-type zinc finger domain-containing protein